MEVRVFQLQLSENWNLSFFHVNFVPITVTHRLELTLELAAINQDFCYKFNMATRLSTCFQILEAAVTERNEKFSCALKVYVRIMPVLFCS